MAIRPIAQARMLGLLALSAGPERIKIEYGNVTELGTSSSKSFLVGLIIIVQFLC